jgi:hypothetical protein
VSLITTLREMDAARAIDPVQGNQSSEAKRWLGLAAEHLDTATAVAESDPAMALEALHQACRKSLVGHMLVAGGDPLDRISTLSWSPTAKQHLQNCSPKLNSTASKSSDGFEIPQITTIPHHPASNNSVP